MAHGRVCNQLAISINAEKHLPIHTYMCVCVYCVHTCTYVRTYRYILQCLYVYTLPIDTYICVLYCLHVDMYVYCVYIYIYIHITRTYRYICVCVCVYCVHADMYVYCVNADMCVYCVHVHMCVYMDIY